MDWKYIMFHHSDSHTEGVDVDTIRQWHLERGFSDVGYHFVILPDGTIQEGRDLNTRGAHCLGMNYVAIGVCLVGDFEKHEPTKEQYKSCRELVERFPRLIPTEHREHVKTLCPGKCFDLNKVLDYEDSLYKKEIEQIKQLGIMNGFEDGFRPTEAVTNERLAVILMRMYEKLGGK